MKKPKFVTNWKTTVMGAITALVGVAPQLMLMFDQDDTTNPDWKIVLTAVAIGAGLIVARDGDKNSAGTKLK